MSGDLMSSPVRDAGAAIRSVVPDLDALVRTVAAFGTHVHSWVHGPQHWQTVAAFGLTLAREAPGADERVALLFGVLHDCLRMDDHRDPEHGRRAGALAVAMNGGLFQLEPARLEVLETALSLHVDGRRDLTPQPPLRRGEGADWQRCCYTPTCRTIRQGTTAYSPVSPSPRRRGSWGVRSPRRARGEVSPAGEQ